MTRVTVLRLSSFPLNFSDGDIEDEVNDKKGVQNSKRRTAHTVAEEKRRDAIKVIRIT